MIRTVLALAAALALLPAAATAKESARRGSFELGATSYRPNIDSEFPGGDGRYELVFGSGRGWGFRAGVSRALFTSYGALELGFRTGVFQENASAFQAGTTNPSADDTSFWIVPTSVTLTYRFDMLARRYNVPLAPYVRAAAERYNWWTSTGDDTSETGATNGWSATAGVAVLLDFFDAGLARELDADTGINDSYLFVDLTKSEVDDFGSSSSWDLSDEDYSLSVGLMFAF